MSSVDVILGRENNKDMKFLTVLILASGLILSPVRAGANPMKEFLVTCAYGTAAGALLGLASLAFTEDPGGKINNVARGASLGLYAGIALGFVKTQQQNQDYEVNNAVYFTPMITQTKVKTLEGAVLNYQIFNF